MATTMDASNETQVVPTEDTTDKDIEASVADANAAHQELLALLCASDPDFKVTQELSAYIHTLCSTPLVKLTTLPSHLTASSQALLKSLQNATIAHHRPLLTSFTLAHSTHDTLLTLHTSLSSLLTLLTTLASSLTPTPPPSALKPRNDSLSTLSNAAHALDLLSAPTTLLQPLLNSSHYSEALSLITYLHNLTLTHSDIPVLQSIESNELPRATTLLQSTLEAQLEEPLPLPQTLHITTLLQRLLPLLPPPKPSPRHLRRIFLNRRWACMRPGSSSTRLSSSTSHMQLSPSSPKSLPSQSTTTANPIVTYCSDFRSGMFEVLTQYRAVFQQVGVDEGEYSGGTSERSTLSNSNKRDSVLESWVSVRIGEFLSCLSTLLNTGTLGRSEGNTGGRDRGYMDGAGLAAGMQQAAYAGASLGRFGADFRPVLAPLFCRAVVRLFEGEVELAVAQFGRMIQEYDWEAPVGGSVGSGENGGFRGQARNDGEEGTGGDQSERQRELYGVPEGILEYGPLAIFVNGVLHALNELRVCCPEGIASEIHGRLEMVVIEAASLMESVGGVGGCLIVSSDSSRMNSRIGNSGVYGSRKDTYRGRKGWEGMAYGLRLAEEWLGRCCTRVVGEGWRAAWVRKELDERLGVMEDIVDVRINVQKRNGYVEEAKAEDDKLKSDSDYKDGLKHTRSAGMSLGNKTEEAEPESPNGALEVEQGGGSVDFKVGISNENVQD
eukprot:Plantae.Rhodophyta-Hildenbrandia_rubra.ctg9319.p1 GENE.Plantae.Rhodophyta-Hildenbrandia_rubra.ctg9319~~Plantae.Rhodophyta-Hildenbrandia_rubra.ctg9319.p1  ORF type:complete len:723 (-),score=113.82 Plantae.Rhodophyta-Hildenbrandia_rubra.ctg9319:3411-5579(-)